MSINADSYLVLGPTLSVSDMTGHDSLCFLAQPGEAFQLKTHSRSVQLIFSTFLLRPISAPKGCQLDISSWHYSSSIKPMSSKVTLLEHWRTVLISSWMTMSTHLTQGSFSLMTCFFTMASNAISGVKSPVLDKENKKDSESQGNSFTWKGLIWIYVVVVDPAYVAHFHL